LIRNPSKSADWLRDYLFYIFLSLGFIVLLIPSPRLTPALWILGVMALAEEIIFRYLIQESLNKLFRHRMYLNILSPANILTSFMFALVHLLNQPVAWALATFFPSIIFGITWDRHKNILACFCLHFFYNVCFFYF